MKRSIRRAIGRSYLKMFGWRATGSLPDIPKFVIIAAPHTTNWDLPFTVALAFHFDMDVQWMGKHTLFESPFGWFFRALGGVPVYRHEKRNMVTQMADQLRDSEEMQLVVATEGTRSLTDSWKSGFYRIACEANVPIVMGYLDFEKKEGGLGPPLYPTGDVTTDMDKIRAFYSDKVGKYPEKFGPIRLKIEGEVHA